jgi:histone H3/H4
MERQLMADNVHVQAGGLPWKATPEQAKQLAGAGGKVISQELAQELAGAQQDINYVDQNWGSAGTAGLGLASGLSLGMAPGLLAQAGILDPNHIQAAETSGLYTAGDIAGTLAPALLSGGESLAARGLAATPAGLMSAAGGLSERLAGRLIADTPGLLGKLGKSAVSQAMRGASEGALINLGHTVGDHLVQNKPLAAESMAAAGFDGALFGGFLGGTAGVVGSLGGHVVDSLSGAVSKAGGKGLRSQAYVAKSLGAEALVEAPESLGTNLKDIREKVLQKGGADIRSSTTEKIAATKSAKELYATERTAAIKEAMETNMVSVPNVDVTKARLRADVAQQYVGTPYEAEVLRSVEKMEARLDALVVKENIPEFSEWVKNQPKPMSFNEFKDWQKSLDPAERYNAGNMAPGEKFTAKELAAWKSNPNYRLYLSEHTQGLRAEFEAFIKELPSTPAGLDKWVKSSDLLLDASKGPGLSQIDRLVTKETQRILGSQVTSTLEEINPSLAEKFAAASMGQRLSEEVEGYLGKKLTNSLMSAEPAVTARDLGAFVGMAAIGHPASGLGWLAAKGIGKQLQGRIEPAMAQMAYDASIGSKASLATLQAQTKIGSSIRNFFKSKNPQRAASTVKAESSKSPRKAYEETYSRTEQLLSDSHQDKLIRYAKELEGQGYHDLALELLNVNHRASQYLQWNMPPSNGAKAIKSLRKLPAPQMPTLQEYKFLRINKAVTNPFSLLEDLDKGKVSRDAVKAVKYVYPELHREIVSSATQQVYEMKASGQFLPMDKISSLGVVLDAPIDTTLTPEYVTAVQMALNAPPPNEESPPQAASLTSPTALMTPIQQTNFS